jgi:hypothetical protein
MHSPDVDEPRPAGAIELLDRDPSSRKRFFKALGGTAAAGAFAAVLAACGTTKPKPTPGGSDPNTAAGVGTDQYGPGDLGIARFAITLEFIEVDFYDQAVATGKLKGRAAELARQFGAQEKQHVKALTQVIAKLGGDVPDKPKATFSLGSAAAILHQASDLEGLGVAALLGQAGRIQDKEFLAAALTMHSVEGRHAAAIDQLLGDDPAPEGAFAKPVFASDVITQLHSLTATG